MFTGNRGCLVEDDGRLASHHRGRLWITCVTEFRGQRQPLAAPRQWTPIFFLDDAVALAAGHRPCGLCRPVPYLLYKEAVTRAEHLQRLLGAEDLNRRLARERLGPGRGLDRAGDRLLWRADIDGLPSGTVIVDEDRRPRLVIEDRLLAFAFDGWRHPEGRPESQVVEVLTPPTSVAALANGYVAELHPSAKTRTTG